MDARPEPSEDLARETAQLRRIARGIVLEPALAEDVVQEAWLAALRAQRTESIGGGWLTEAVRRIALGLRRGEARRTTREQRAARTEAQPSAADAAARVELLQELLAALAALEEPYRTAVQLRLVDDLPPREIAQRTGVPVETARTRVKRGIERLRTQLDQRHAGRREEFIGLIAPLAGWGGWESSKALGGVAVGAKTKVVLIVALLAAAGVWWARPWDSAHSERTPGTLADASVVSAEELARTSTATSADPALTPNDATEAGTARTLLTDKTSWVLRGRALLDKDQPLAGADVRLRVVRGYEQPGPLLHDDLVRSGDNGAFELALPTPDSAVLVVMQAEQSGYLGFSEERLVLRGAPAPTDLVARLFPLDVVLRGHVLDPESRPVSGARVKGRGPAVTTGEDGRFETPASTFLHEVTLWASADGLARGHTIVAVERPGVIEGLEIKLGDGCTLRGRVLDEAGRAVAGARITAFLKNEVDATSAEDGRFVLTGLSRDASWISFHVAAEGYVHLRHDLEDGRVPEEEVEMRLLRGVEVRGQVLDEDGHPLPGTLVYMGDSRWSSEVVSAVAADEGRYLLRNVSRTEHLLGAEHEGLAAYEARVELPQQGESEIVHDIVLAAGVVVHGLVVDENGAPLSGVHVAVQRGGQYMESLSARTDAAGRFDLRGVPTGRRLGIELYATGFVRLETFFDPSGRGDLRYVMKRSAGFAGRVVDAVTGAPIPAFRVRLVPAALVTGDVPLTGHGATWSAEGGVLFHDADGRWDTSHEQLEVGQVTGIEVTAPGYGPAIVARAVARHAPEAQPVVIALGPGRSLRGVVVDARDGRGVRDAIVRRFTARDSVNAWSSRGEDTRAEARTDARGDFLFEGLPVEPMSLYVEVDGFAPTVDGPIEPIPDGPVRRIELHPGAVLRGVLHDSDGAALGGEGVGISARVVAGQEHRDWELRTDAEGRFALSGLAPGTYQVSRLLPYERGATWDLIQMVEVAPEREHEVELRPRGHVRLVVRLSAGMAATGEMNVIAVPVPGASGAARTWRGAVARDGHFEIDGLEEGAWEIKVIDNRPGAVRIGKSRVDIAPGTTGMVAVEVEIGRR